MATGGGGATGPIWERTVPPAWVKAVNLGGSAARRLGLRWPRLDPDRMARAARRRTGLNDFGGDRFREGFRVLVDAFESADSAHAFGRIFFREYVTSLLANRLKIQADLSRHPEIRDVPVNRPLFITGLSRRGTTFLHRLMSEDPACRTLRFWEAMEPSPPPAPETDRTDPRIARARRSVDLINRLAPRIASAHELSAEGPEEDNNLFAHAFAAAIFGFMFDVPDYARWLDDLTELDLVENYRYAKAQLQLLSWKLRGDYWLLKAPAHQYSLGALLTAFPDARVVVTHRDPLRAVPSVCRLAAGFRGMLTDRLDLRRLGAEFVEAMAVGPARVIAARAKSDPSRFVDVPYPRLVADPIGTVRDVHRHFGGELSPEFEARARRHLDENPQHKHGVHRYALGDFGLDAGTVDRHFAPYRAWLAANLPDAV